MLFLPTDGSGSSRLDELLDKASRASSRPTRNGAVSSAGEEVTDRPDSAATTLGRQRSRRVSTSHASHPPPHVQEHRTLTQHLAAEYRLECERKAKDAEARAANRRQEESARKRIEASSWREAQQAQAAVVAEAERRKKREAAAAHKDALAEVQRQRALAKEAAAKRASEVAAADAAQRAERERRQRAAARVVRAFRARN